MGRKVNEHHNQARLYQLMRHVFDIDELKELYFELGIDKDNVSQSANKAEYTRYLIRSIAREHRQTELLTLVKRKRPGHKWPDDYLLVEEQDDNFLASTPLSNYNIENVTIYTISSPSFNSAKQARNKYPKDKLNQLKEIEEDVYNKFLIHTPKYVYFLTVVGLTNLFVCIIIKEIEYLGLGIFVSLAIWMFGLRVMFSKTHTKIRKSTNYYDLSVTDREKIKHRYETRNWGNWYLNFGCKFLIKYLIETDLNRARKKRMA